MRWTIVAITTALAACALPAAAETMKMKAELKGASEVPAVAGSGMGMVDVTYDTSSKQLSWTGTYNGLTGPATAAHFHGPADPGANAPVAVPSPASAGNIMGSATLTDAQAAALAGGKMYFNIHTAANPSGEIRGQVVK